MTTKNNILFLDFDGVLNSHRSLFKKIADYHGVKWIEEDFGPEYWEDRFGMNPDLLKRIDDESLRQEVLPGYIFQDLDKENYPPDEIAIENLNKIIEENEASVVISSSWGDEKTLEELQEILNSWGAKCEVIDIIPPKRRMRDLRGEQILYWVKEYKEFIKGICILDDEVLDKINHVFKPWCVQDINEFTHGLRSEHIEKAKECFNKPFTDNPFLL